MLLGWKFIGLFRLNSVEEYRVVSKCPQKNKLLTFHPNIYELQSRVKLVCHYWKHVPKRLRKWRQVDSSWIIGSPQSLFCFVGFLELCTVAGKIQVPSVNSEKYSPDSWLLTRIWFTKQSNKQKYKAKFAVELLWFPHYSFIALQTDRHSGSYFSTTLRRPFGTFLFFSFHWLFAMYMFSLLLQFHSCKNICLSCQQKYLPFVSSKTVCVFTLPSDTSATQWGKNDMVRFNCET